MTRPRAILVWSGKGGVGKSTLAASLAAWLSRTGGVGLLDADVTGPSAAALLGVDSERLGVQGGRIIPCSAGSVRVASTALLVGEDVGFQWNGAVVQGAVLQLAEETDWSGCRQLVVDLPPGTGDVHLRLLETLDVAGSVVVTSQHALSYADTLRSLDLLSTAKVPILATVENSGATPWPDHGSQVGADLARRTRSPLFRLPHEREVGQALAGVCRGSEVPTSSAYWSTLADLAEVVGRACDERTGPCMS